MAISLAALCRTWGHHVHPEWTRGVYRRVHLTRLLREQKRCQVYLSINKPDTFLQTVHAAVFNLFNPGRHLVSARTYRFFRLRAFASWNCAVT